MDNYNDYTSMHLETVRQRGFNSTDPNLLQAFACKIF